MGDTNSTPDREATFARWQLEAAISIGSHDHTSDFAWDQFHAGWKGITDAELWRTERLLTEALENLHEQNQWKSLRRRVWIQEEDGEAIAPVFDQR